MALTKPAGLALAGMTLCALAACAQHPQPTQSQLFAAALSEGTWTGTLCSGPSTSFDCRFSVHATDLAVKRKRLIKHTEDGTLAHDEAQSIQNSLNSAHTLLQAALNACQVDSHNGECANDQSTANEDLVKAVQVLQAVQFP